MSLFAEEERGVPRLRMDEDIERSQITRLNALRAKRDSPASNPPSASSSAAPPLPKIFSQRSSLPSRPTPRSAKSPTHSAESSANTRSLSSFDAYKVMPEWRLPKRPRSYEIHWRGPLKSMTQVAFFIDCTGFCVLFL